MMREHDEEPELTAGQVHPVEDADIIDEVDEADEVDERGLAREDFFFDDDAFADGGDLDYEDEPSF